MTRALSGGAKIKKALVVVGLFFLVLCGIAGIIYSRSDFGEAAGKYESNKKEWERLGLLSTLEEYRAMIAVDPSENAGPEFKEFLDNKANIALFRDISFGNIATVKARLAGGAAAGANGRGSGGNIASQSEMLAVAEFLESDLSIAISALEKMTKKPTCIIPKTFVTLSQTTFPKFDQVWNIFRVLVALAEDSLDRGKVKDALKLYRMSAQLCLWQDDSGWLIGNLVRLKCTRYLKRILKSSMVDHSENREFLRAMPGLLKLIDGPFDIERTLKTEGVLLRESVKMIQATDQVGLFFDDGGRALESRIQIALFRLPITRRALLSRTYEPYTIAMQMRPKNKADLLAWQAALAKVDTFGRMPLSQKPSYALIPLTIPGFKSFIDSIIANDRDSASMARIIEVAENRFKAEDMTNRLWNNGKQAKDLDGVKL